MRLASVVLLLPLTLAAQSLTGKGVSVELAQRRARTIKDVRYDLSLDITAPDSAVGTVTARWSRSDPGDAIFDFRGRRLTSITVNPTVSDFKGLSVPLSAYNGAHIVVPASVLHQGDNIATFTFATDIAPSGASIIKSHDPDGSDYLYFVAKADGTHGHAFARTKSEHERNVQKYMEATQ